MARHAAHAGQERPVLPYLSPHTTTRPRMPTILLSEAIAARYGDRITARPWFGPGWRIAAFRPGAGLAPEVVNDIQAAYLSYDILGGSTADMHEPRSGEHTAAR